jgi:hypothetical protein
MGKTVRRAVVSVVAASVLSVTGLAGTASAQVIQDGLVNVNVGDVTILEDVNVGVAANAAVQACGISVGPVAIGVLARAIAVDRTGNTMTICRTDQGPVTITQNTE